MTTLPYEVNMDVSLLSSVTWAWNGNAFIFESTEDLNAINAYFAPGTLIT
jgi:hypothetical protein